MAINNKRAPSKTFRASYIIIGLIIIVLAGLVILLGHNSIFKSNPSAQQTPTASSYTKGQPQPTRTNANHTSNSNQTQQNNNPKTSSGSYTTLLTPYGDFVSDHSPNLSGSPHPNTLTSVCDTTPGASCKIVFTMDGNTITLPAQTVDSGGSTYWLNWKLQDYNFIPGSWKIEAIATLDGQTKTANDSQNMVVSE